jgi:Ca2+-binding EF-hand superfamily protein
MNMRKLVMTAMALALVGNFQMAYANPGAGSHFGAEIGESAGSGEDAERPEKPQRDHAIKLRHKVKRIFNAVDLDGSGTITLDEWLVKTTEKAKKHFDRIDANDDSLISPQEFLAAGHDRDKDLEVDPEELRACVADATGEAAPERPDRDTEFDRIDTNDDGFIDPDEFLAAKTEQATSRFNAIDTDGDGAITKQELAEALKHLHEIKRVRRDCVEDQREADDLIG